MGKIEGRQGRGEVGEKVKLMSEKERKREHEGGMKKEVKKKMEDIEGVTEGGKKQTDGCCGYESL